MEGERSPEYDKLCSQISPAFLAYPPAFVYINNPINPRRTSAILKQIFLEESDSLPRIRVACVDGIAAFTPRIFYDTVINALADHRPRWETGCSNWMRFGSESDSSDGDRYNETFGSFVRGLQSVRASHVTTKSVESAPDTRFIILVTNPERMRESLPDIFVPLTRLAELAQMDSLLSVIFVSAVRWEDIRPPLGASPDPYFIDIGGMSKGDVIETLASSFDRISATSSDGSSFTSIYHPALRTLYSHFIDTLVNVCYPFTHDPDELAYVAAAQWPAFARAALQLGRGASHSEGLDDEEMGEDDQDAVHGEDPVDADGTPVLPNEYVRMRLLRQFTPSMTAALEALYPRLMSAAEWAAKMSSDDPPAKFSSIPSHPTSPTKSHSFSKGATPNSRHFAPTETTSADTYDLSSLPRMHKFILLAAFIASTNPAKSDLRVFGRGLDERSRRKRRRGGGTSSRGGRGPSKATKIPQRLLGPAPFPLDRLLAILGALLEDNDAEGDIPEEGHTDLEVGRAGILSTVTSLSNARLLHRTSASDKLDGPPTFKCGISYEPALQLARDLDVPLGDLLWEVV